MRADFLHALTGVRRRLDHLRPRQPLALRLALRLDRRQPLLPRPEKATKHACVLSFAPGANAD